MLLSIDRVLQLLTEKKSIEKISELANCSIDDVIAVIEKARSLLNKYEKPVSKKKIIIKKNDQSGNESAKNQADIYSLLNGAELSAVPLKSKLTIYIGGISEGNPGPAGIGVVIYDKEDRQVGKISSYIGINTNSYAEYKALLRALDVGIYFDSKDLNIRTNSELIVKQINGTYQIKNEKIEKLYDQAMKKFSKFRKIKIEHVTTNLNDKADYLAKKASTTQKNFNE